MRTNSSKHSLSAALNSAFSMMFNCGDNLVHYFSHLQWSEARLRQLQLTLKAALTQEIAIFLNLKEPGPTLLFANLTSASKLMVSEVVAREGVKIKYLTNF